MDMEVGERYTLDELPDNGMNNSGRIEWIDDDVLALAHGGKLYEFKFAVECTAVINVDENGNLETLSGIGAHEK